ncbi:spore germination protein [Paenisporosarcina sp.]|uniref:spore germination protein n=1 Tax=Paenisporosarcina sp. TaxID=1932001 RepID=UPI003C71FBD3
MKKWFQKKKSESKESTKDSTKESNENLSEIMSRLKKSSDFISYSNDHSSNPLSISYFKSLIDVEILHRDILAHISDKPIQTYEELKAAISVENIMITSEIDKIEKMILTGFVMIQLDEKDNMCALVRAELRIGRTVSIPEVEFSVVGPKESFVESLDSNLNLIRKRLPISDLQTKEIMVGSLTKTRVAVLYLEKIADEENVNTVIQRLNDIEFDQIIDSSYIAQIIADNQNSPFPQLLDTERPDRVAAVLAEGKVVILVNGSPHALIGPTTIIEFFSAFEDYYLSWHIASIFRMIRLFAVAFSIFSTPIYVAVVTYHYELIPKELMVTLVTSRSNVPFPPILEVIFLEMAIELLREAGARLPTKIGQTIGIVGGIVIGTAAVEAALVSNVLLIIVALAALASFTTPVYKMNNSIRLIRFPFLLFAQLWGLVGVVLCFCFFLVHLIRLTSLGRPFLEPIYPPRWADWQDALIRLPFSSQSKRPILLRTKDSKRFNKKQAKEKKDIDE